MCEFIEITDDRGKRLINTHYIKCIEKDYTNDGKGSIVEVRYENRNGYYHAEESYEQIKEMLEA